MKAKVKSLDGYADSTANDNCEWLLKNIKAVTMQFDAKHNGYISMLDATASFLNCRQQQGQSADSYLEALKSRSDTIEYHGGTLVLNPKLAPETRDDGTRYTDDERMKIARDCTLAAALIRGSDPTRYGTLIADLSNQYSKGKDEYPKDLASAYSLLVNYRTPTNAARTRYNNSGNATDVQSATSASTNTPAGGAEGSAMTFAQRATATPGTNGITHDGVTCYRCFETGHYASDCPNDAVSTASGTTLVQYGFTLAQGVSGIDPSWILLDSQSTISVFRNADMLTNIRPSNHVLRAVKNGGHQDSTLVGDFPNLGKVWFNPQSIANILSLAEVRKVCRVTMDTASEPAMVVHRLDGSSMKFAEHGCGLYVYVPSNASSARVTAYTLVSTVAAQKKLFSRRNIVKADAARALYRMIGRPSEADFESILAHGLIRNCPVTPLDAKRAHVIYGPDIATLKGKTTRTGIATHAPVFESFRTVSSVPDRTRSTMVRELKAVLHLYAIRGFVVCDIHADHKFECIRDAVSPIHLDIVAPDSHVGEIERSVRTVKERLRATVHGLPFKRLPKLMIVHMVADAVRRLNMFPAANGISPFMSPLSLVTGVPPPDYTSLRLEFGTYVQLFQDHSPSNTIAARTLGAIALTPTGNAHGDYHFLSLSSGCRVSRHRWTALPMTDIAIARVESLALHEKQPLIQEDGLVVEWRPNQPVDVDEYDRDYVPPLRDAVDDPLLPGDYAPLDPDELASLHADAVPLGDAPLPAAALEDQGAPTPQLGADDQEEAQEVEHNSDLEDNVSYEDNGSYGVEDDDAAYDDDEAYDNCPDANDPDHEHTDNDVDDDPSRVHMSDDELEVVETNTTDVHHHGADMLNQGARMNQGAAPQTQYSLRDRVNTAALRFRTAMDEPFNIKSYFPPTQLFYADIFRYIMDKCATDTEFAYTMTQMSANAGIKKHGRRAMEALMAEFAQLEDLSAYEPLDPTKLTRAQKKAALRAINLIKEKRCGKLKGRTVADGRGQRTLYDKSETASPTVATDSLMISVACDAHERRNVGTADIAGAYLKAYMKDFVIMKFTGASVDILCEMNPKYTAFVTIENGTKVIYVRLIKALYGCVQSALLWYQMFHSYLEEIGFELNPYDPCVANKIIKGKQCTIAWYVDDMKVSHVDPNVVTEVIEQIESRFGKMTVTRGKEHTFLGMKISYKENGTAEITMRDYLEEAIVDSGLAIDRVAATPAKRDLFETDVAARALDKKDAEVFHSVSAKLLYVAIRARMDILLPVIFLCTRVSKCTVQDQAKLKRVLEYLKGTLHYKYTLGADEMGKVRTWVDASYAVHPDMKSHTGGLLSFGTGGLVCKSGKQKLNTKSSTEAELVGASDYLPNLVMWVHNFLKGQGYEVKESTLQQDNKSAIKLEKNGRMSAGQKSRHIDIRYFWIKDRVQASGVAIQHCPTLEMLADFFTKPLQGNLFRRFRDVILGYSHIDTLRRDPAVPVEERVEKEQPNTRDTAPPGANETKGGQEKGKNAAREHTWADVVKGSVRGAKRSALLGKETKGFVASALSCNNPVS